MKYGMTFNTEQQKLTQQSLLPSVTAMDKVFKYSKFLSEGSNGLVYLYENDQSDDKVAVKVQRDHYDDSIDKQFTSQLEKYRQIDNHNLLFIPKLFSDGIIEDARSKRKYLVMEFLEHSVLEHINQIKPVYQDRVIENFKTMLQTL